MSLNEGRLSIIINSPLFQVELKKMEREIRDKAIESIGDVRARIAQLQEPAVQVLEDIVRAKDGEVGIALKQKTAIAVLEMSGVGKKKNDEGMSDFAQFITEAYNDAKQRAFSELDQSLDEEVAENQQVKMLSEGCVDISGEVLSVDEAEDQALAAAEMPEPVVVEEPVEETEKQVSPHAFSVGHVPSAGENGGSGDKALNSLLLSAMRADGVKLKDIMEILK
jgi:hypothetical protein